MFVIIPGIILMCLPAKSQVVSKDSINTLRQQKEVIELAKELNEQKLKLAKLENSVENKRQDMETAQKDAQKAADRNADIASKLSSDPGNRKLARKAKNAAKQVKRDSRQSRSAADDFQGLQNDIDALKKKIADNEEKLSSLQGSVKSS